MPAINKQALRTLTRFLVEPPPHDAKAGSTGSAKLVNSILDPIPVGPAGIAMLASPCDGGELVHGELADDLVGAVGLGIG